MLVASVIQASSRTAAAANALFGAQEPPLGCIVRTNGDYSVSEQLIVTFPAGKRVDVRVGDFDIPTDQSVKLGGEASAPTPFALFLASMAACSGIYALDFCQTRNISTEGLGLSMDWEQDAKAPAIAAARLSLRLPEGFPAQYRESIVKAMDLCAVKKHIMTPPRFEIEIVG
jgi:ribosomal protein S12 methylthiotransferase accessory factor